MEKTVTFDCYHILSPLGTLADTTAALYRGLSGIREEPFCGNGSSYAPFQDTRYRHIDVCIPQLFSGVTFESINPERTILIYCAAKGDLSSLKTPPPAHTVSPLLGEQLSLLERLSAYRFAHKIAISTACSSGAIGLETAVDFLVLGYYDHAVVVGFDVLSEFVVSGFFALGALSSSRARPFDSRRDGLTLGEAAGIAVLSYRKPEQDDIYIAGAGSSNDANHRTGPSRTGEGLVRAAHAALSDAGAGVDSIAGVKCHGTATDYNDAMESKALYKLFGDAIPPCASLKGALGHTSGASSLIECIIAAEALRMNRLPPTAGFESKGVDEPVAISSRPQELKGNGLLCLSAGFGGINAATILRKEGGN
jgi:3-oxoacyl-[acyl-carrier-protein] synthase-1